MLPDDQSVIDALRAGARGYLTKDAGGAEIRQALLHVLDDQVGSWARGRRQRPTTPGGVT
jgi:DNA-binding NarL/FixJ family response regulator